MEAKGVPIRTSGGGTRGRHVAPRDELVDAPVQEAPQPADEGAAL